MSSTPSTTPSSSNFEAILNAALDKYTKYTGQDLRNHPLVSEIDRCNSAESILAIFQEQAKAFQEFRNHDPKLLKYLRPTVNGLYALSTTLALSTTIDLVSPTNFLYFLTVFLMMLSCRRSPLHHQSSLGSVSFYLCVSFHAVSASSSDISGVRCPSR
jgi:hypothetical protein